MRVVIVSKAGRAYGPLGGGYAYGYPGGLAENVRHTVTVLRALGHDVTELVVTTAADLLRRLPPDASLVVLEAVWVTLAQLQVLAGAFPGTRFVTRVHSKMGFLQVEPEAIATLRAVLAFGHPRIALASNNREFSQALGLYGPTLYLPNLYDLGPVPRLSRHGGPLHIGSPGASRLLKMHVPAALAALQASRALGRDLWFHVNVDATPGGDGVRRAVQEVLRGVAHVVATPWQDGPAFRQDLPALDAVMQLSATESFCLVAADAVAMGVPVVTGTAIAWLPPQYAVPDDDTTAASGALQEALADPWVWQYQYEALCVAARAAQDVWQAFLKEV